MLKLAHWFKKLGYLLGTRPKKAGPNPFRLLVVSFTVLIIFLNPTLTPAFATTEPPQTNNAKKALACSDNQLACTQLAQEENDGLLSTLSGTGYYAVLAFGGLDKDQQESLMKSLDDLAEHIPIEFIKNDKEFYVKFYTNYINHLFPLLTKAFASKVAGRVSKNLIFSKSKDMKSALPLSNTMNFLMRNGVESTRNISPMTHGENKKEDGKVIRNSLLLQGIIFIPIELFTGFGVNPFLKLLGQPSDTRDLVETYMGRRAISGAPAFDELSGRTAEKILSIERPGLQFLLPTVKAGSTILTYFAFNKFLGAETVGKNLQNLAMAEGTSGILVTIGMLGVLCFDEKYKDYEIFNIKDGIWDTKIMGNLFWSYGVPVLKAQLAQTIGGSLDVALMGLSGKNVLAAQKDFKLYDLLIGSIISSMTRAGQKTIKELKKDSTPKEINKAFKTSILTTASGATLYAIPCFVAIFKSNDPIVKIISCTQSLAGFLFALERTAKEAFETFKKEEMPDMTTGELLKVGIPAAEYAIARSKIIDLSSIKGKKIRTRGIVNYAAMKLFSSIVSAIWYTSKAWDYHGLIENDHDINDDL